MTRSALASLALLLPATALLMWPRAAGPAGGAGERLGTFRVTVYYVAEERHRGPWPLYGPGCRRVLAHTSRRFHHALSREGTGRLRDGRLLNFSERCGCARPGHAGSRVCYEALDPRRFPWGKGGRIGGRFQPLRPFRSVAVDPAVVPLGTWLYVPAWAGRPGPRGRPWDGCVRAEDTGARVRGRHLDLFAGSPRRARRFLRDGPGSRAVRVYRASRRCARHRTPPE